MADWAEARPLRMGARGRTCRDLWDAIPEPSWLATYARQAGVPPADLVRAAAMCAESVLGHVAEGDRPAAARAIRAAMLWAGNPAGERIVGPTHVMFGTGDDGRVREGMSAWHAARAAMWAEGAPGLSLRHVSDVAATAKDRDIRDRCMSIVRETVPFLDLAGGGR